jgi:hypothetical protein
VYVGRDAPPVVVHLDAAVRMQGHDDAAGTAGADLVGRVVHDLGE